MNSTIYFAMGFNYAHAKAVLIVKNDDSGEETHLYNLQNGTVCFADPDKGNYQLDMMAMDTEAALSVIGRNEETGSNPLTLAA